MFRRLSLIFPLLLLIFTAACGQPAIPPVDSAGPTSVATSTAAMVMPPTEVSPTSTPFPTVTPFPTFTPLPAQAEQTGGPTTAPTCTNVIEFVKNLTINDNTMLDAETAFAKIWQVKNAGTCTWTTAYSLVYVTGEQMRGPVSVPLGMEIQPGQTADLRLDLVSPLGPGVFTGSWMLQDGNGNRFGLAPDGSQPLNLTIQIHPKPMGTAH